MVFTLPFTKQVGSCICFHEVLGIGSEEVVTLITQQKEQRSSNDNGKTNETRSW
jgi:hypothetical protein